MPTLFFWIITSIDSAMDRLTAEWQLMLLFIIVMVIASCIDVRPNDKSPSRRSIMSYKEANMQLPTYSPPLSPKSDGSGGHSARAFPFRRSSGPEMTTSRGWIPSIIHSVFKSSSDSNHFVPEFSDPFHPGGEFHRVARWSYPIPPYLPHTKSSPPLSSPGTFSTPSSSTWACFTPGYLKFDGDLMRRSKSFPVSDTDRAWVARQAGPGGGSGMGTGMRGRKRSKKYEIRKLEYVLTTVEEDRIMEAVEEEEVASA